MRLEDIGFYTLCDARAKAASETSPMWRAELIVTDRCNFKCPYCRGVPANATGDLPVQQALSTLKFWTADRLRNVRFSGGEPTLYEPLGVLVHEAKADHVDRVAISTNGSASKEKYDYLIWAGVNDVSVSLDACCAADADQMAGCSSHFDKIAENIRFLASRVYTTVGVVLTEQNEQELAKIIDFADGLGVSDIRVIPAAQHGRALNVTLRPEILAKYPILRYRIGSGVHDVRGLKKDDPCRCHLVLDDSAVVGECHYPCIIYLREHGKPIGRVGPDMRAERVMWAHNHDTWKDPICRGNCLDVCVEYNRTFDRCHCEF